jgi:hypothetical protein
LGFSEEQIYIGGHTRALGTASDNGEEDSFINSMSAYANNSTSLNEKVGIRI